MKFKIEKINEKEISTSRGMSTKVGIFCNGKWYGAWKGQWNADWKVGQILDIPDDRVSSNKGNNGKEFWNIAAPPKVATNGSPAVDGQLLHKLVTTLEEIKADLTAIKAHLGLEAEPSGDTNESAPASAGRYQPDDNDIPF